MPGFPRSRSLSRSLQVEPYRTQMRRGTDTKIIIINIIAIIKRWSKRHQFLRESHTDARKSKIYTTNDQTSYYTAHTHSLITF